MSILSLTRAQTTALLKQWAKARVREIEKDKDESEAARLEQLNTLGNAWLDLRGGLWKASTPVKDASKVRSTLCNGRETTMSCPGSY